MRQLSVVVALGAVLGLPAVAHAQGATDLYHVHFTKAVPGQAVALGDELKKPDPTSPMPNHFIVLRHQEGDDWDYCVIEHLGAKAEITTTAAPPPAAVRAMRAWHNDTFVSGPTWAEFSKAMGIGDGATGTGGSVYNVQVWREAPGHREQLQQALKQVGGGAPSVPRVILQHVEGGPWTFVAIDRYASWQEFAADQTASAASAGGWGDLRAHSTYHHDTLADRITGR